MPVKSVGRYELLEVIGRGGAAVVYLALQRDLGRRAALKELAPFQAALDSSFAARFAEESRLTGSLSHPNIVIVFEFLEEGGVPYIAMEYLPRGSLRQYVGSLTLPQIAGVLEGVLAGLAHGESRSVVHRDLKPENLLVTDDGRVKIADFGVARAYADAVTRDVVTATGTTIGTPAYMAPEQALGREVRPAADLYSLGIVAWELLTGRVPFEDRESPVAVLYRQVHEPVPPVRSVAADVDPRIEAWLSRMLAKDPADRFPGAEAAWEALEDVVLELLGPRWRRDARLPVVDPGAAGRPLTPAVFEERPPRPAVERTVDAVSSALPAATQPRKRSMRRGAAIAGVLAAVVAAIVMVAVAAGGGAGRPPAPGPGKSTASLAEWTVQGDEMPGFVPISTHVYKTPQQYDAANAAALRRGGYRLGVVENLEPTTATAGIDSTTRSEVVELASPAAARRLAVLHVPAVSARPPGTTFKSFTVAGVPGAEGLDVITLGLGRSSSSVADAAFAEGSCVLVITDSAARHVVPPEQHAAAAIYRRTHGVCP